MPIAQLHSFLVQPAKNEEEQPAISGARLQLKGKLFEMLSAMFEQAHDECDIEIVFRPASDGQQQNDCRELLVTYLAEPAMENGRAVAERLQSISTHRSGLGLLFLAAGTDADGARLMLSRFPADQGVIAHEHARRLEVEFIERVFMKSARAYKSALYVAPRADAGFWDGRAVDKQIDQVRELSNYWILDFLDSELRTTGAAGTKRLAVALREAIRKTTSSSVRDELVSVARLSRNQAGRTLSPASLADQFGLSPESRNALQSTLPRAELYDERFRFDVEEFDEHVAYRSVELDNGGLLIGETANFDQIFHEEPALDGTAGRVRFTTEGRVVNQQLRKSR